MFAMIPDYQSIMLPLLKLLAGSNEVLFRDAVEKLASVFHLSDEERRELLPSGTQPIFNNRVGWAKSYLKKAGLLDSPKRGVVTITELGRDVVSKKPEKIDVAFLKQFPSFVEFISASRSTANQDEDVSLPSPDIDHTPEEKLASAYQSIREALATDLLQKVTELSPAFFERLVVDLLVKMGYGGSVKDAGKALGRTGDEGIDGTIKEDKLGLDIIYIQAKRWKPGNVVGRPELQKFVGALAGQGAKKGIFITTSSFTKDALDYTPRNETKIVLIDGKQLTQLMIDYSLGCTTDHIYEVKRLDLDYFGDE